MNKLYLLILIAILNVNITHAQNTRVRYDVSILPVSDNAYDLGTSTKLWRNIFMSGSDGCLRLTGGLINSTGVACGSGGGGGSGGGTWSTTTSTVSGRLINYSNNTTDIVTVGNTATTTGAVWFDPNTLINYFKGKVGIGTTSPYTALSVVGEVAAEKFTATSTTATSTFRGGITGPNNFNVQAATGWVGIGITAQENPFDLYTTQEAGSGTTIRTAQRTTAILNSNTASGINNGIRGTSGTTYFNGPLDTGTVSGSYQTCINQSTTTGFVNHLYCLVGRSNNTGAGATTKEAAGVYANFTNSAGTTTNGHGLTVESPGLSGGMVANYYGIKVNSTAVSGTGVLGNAYGAHITIPTTATSTNVGLAIGTAPTGVDSSLYVSTGNSYFGGNVGIGTTSPMAMLSVNAPAATNSFAIGSSTGTHVLVNQNGSMGIGTVSPSAKLQVVSPTGTVADFRRSALNYFTVNGSTGFFETQSDNNSVPVFTVKGTGTADTFVVYDDSTAVLNVKDGGFVGIGTTTPIANLAVAGTGAGNFFRLNRTDAAAGFDIDLAGASANLNADSAFKFQINNIDRGAWTVTGLGVGTTTPQGKLSVSTTATASSLATLAAGSSLYTENGIVGSALSVDTATNNALIQGVVTTTGVARPFLINPYGGNVSIGTTTAFGRLGIHNSTDAATAVVISGSSKGIRMGTTATGGLLEGVDYTGSGSYQPLSVGGSDVRFTTSGTERVRLDSSGNVGIGTSSPSNSLEVNGNIYGNGTLTSGGNLTVNGVARIGAASSLLSNPDLQVNGTGGGALRLIRVDSNTSNDELLGTLTFGATDGNVASAASISARAAEPFTGSVNGAYLVFGVTPIGSASVFEAMRLSSSGYLGIGTSTPDVRLNVVGSSGTSRPWTRNARTVASFENNTAVGTAISIIGNSSGYSGIFFGDNTAETTGNLRYDHSTDMYRFFTDVSTERFTIAGNTGNVGAGTTSPSARFAIAGTQGGTAPILLVSTSTASYATSTTLIIDSNGRVGVGTSSPNSLLEVNGSFHVEERTLATSTSMSIDFCNQDTSNNLRMGVGSANITVTFTNFTSCVGKKITLRLYNPSSGVIGSTTFSASPIYWDGYTTPGSNVTNGGMDEFIFDSTMGSSTPFIWAKLNSTLP